MSHADPSGEKQHVSIVVAGHVDAGKSSLTGRLLYDMGGIDERTMEKLRKKAEENGKPSFAFAYYLDNQKAEQERGITIACNTKEFYTSRYHYTIIDAPGHRDFIKNMITGSSQADVALLLCPADGSSFIASIAKGDHKTGEVPGQTRNHARLLNLLGIKQLIVGVNKMDSEVAGEKYGEKRYTEIATEVRRILLQEGWKKEQIEKEIPILPLAGFHGENLLKKSEKMPWWKGVKVTDPTTKKEIQVDCLLDALNDMVNLPPRNTTAALRAPVGKVITTIKGVECVITSRIEQGTLAKGDEVVFLPTHTASNACVGKIFSIEMHHKEHARAEPGDNVGLSVKGLPKANMPRDGDIMVKKTDTGFKATETFVVQAMVLEHPGQIKPGYSPVCYVRTSHAACRLMSIAFKAGKKSTGGQKVEGPEFIEKGDMCELTFKPTRPFVVDDFKSCESLSRVAMLEGSVVCMIGKVVKVNFVEDVAGKGGKK
jgi:elongation factor 1-alpha